MATCRNETKAYRNCLHEKRASGRSCDGPAITLESCRSRHRTSNNKPEAANTNATFDGTRVLPNKACRPLNSAMQKCLAWKGGHEDKCREEIRELEECMGRTEGRVVEPTRGDKIWSDYKGKK
mmetsp:Transcript_34832/g.84169  ORF Transcript_34832/g.84169 Transcript_34832/m.84169 type:complete len:123 (+) Transcript_34832:160-528(+)